MIDSPTLTSATVANYANFSGTNLGTFANATITEAGLRVSVSAGGTPDGGKAYAPFGMSDGSGKWYFEMYQSGSGGIAYNVLGVGTALADKSTALGVDTEGFGLYDVAGQVLYNSGLTSCGGMTVIGSMDVVGIALDADARSVDFYVNGTYKCTFGFSGTSGDIYAMTSPGAQNGYTQANFGATSFSYSPPSGYNAGLYSGSTSTPPVPPPTIPDFPVFSDAIYSGCSTIDIVCFATSTFGYLFAYDETYVASNTEFLSYTLLHKFPIGYITDIVDVFSTTTEGTLTVIDATIPGALGFGSTQHIHLDITHVFDFLLNATTSQFNNVSASSTETFFEITNHYWSIIVYISALLYILYRTFPSLFKKHHTP